LLFERSYRLKNDDSVDPVEAVSGFAGAAGG
jgi:hypothetical protein